MTSPPSANEQRRAPHAARPLHSVAIQPHDLNRQLGIEMAMLAAAKKPMPSGEMPVAYMWCTHRPKRRNAVAMSASTTSV